MDAEAKPATILDQRLVVLGIKIRLNYSQLYLTFSSAFFFKV